MTSTINTKVSKAQTGEQFSEGGEHPEYFAQYFSMGPYTPGPTLITILWPMNQGTLNELPLFEKGEFIAVADNLSLECILFQVVAVDIERIVYLSSVIKPCSTPYATASFHE